MELSTPLASLLNFYAAMLGANEGWTHCLFPTSLHIHFHGIPSTQLHAVATRLMIKIQGLPSSTQRLLPATD